MLRYHRVYGWKKNPRNRIVSAGGGGGGGGNDLASPLAFWNYEEAAGNARVDSTGNGNDLAEQVSTVIRTTGRLNFGGETDPAFETGYLGRASVIELAYSGAFTINGWFQRRQLGVHQWFGSTGWYEIGYNGTRARFGLRDSGGSVIDVTANAFGAIAVDTWYMVTCYYDGAGVTGILINGGSENSTELVYTPPETPHLMTVGETSDTAIKLTFDLIGIWDFKLSASDIATLYNGGAGFDPTA